MFNYFNFNYSTIDSFEALLYENVEDDVEVDENTISPNEIEEDELNECERANKRAKNLSFGVWNYFEKPVKHLDGKLRAKCKYLKRDLVGGGSLSGTSTLICHMNRCQKKPHSIAESNVGKLVLDHIGRSTIIHQKVLDEKISMMIIDHDVAFSFVEYKRFRELILYLFPEAKLPFRRVATLNVNKLYDNDKLKLKHVLSKLPSRINLIADVWTSCTSKDYIASTTHYVDQNWKLQNKILNFFHFPTPHFGREMTKIIYSFLKDWGSKQIFFINSR